MKYNELIAALVSLQKSDVNPEVIDAFGEKITGIDFIDNCVVIVAEMTAVPFDDEPGEIILEDEETSDETITPPVEFRAPDFKM